MPWVNNVLVVAGVAASCDELHEAMLAEARRASTRFVLVMPRCLRDPRGAMHAAFALQRVLARAGDAGLELSGRFGDSDPLIATLENYDPRLIDRIIVSLPEGPSRWCATDLAARVRRLTGAPVLHVQVKATGRGPKPLASAAA